MAASKKSSVQKILDIDALSNNIKKVYLKLTKGAKTSTDVSTPFGFQKSISFAKECTAMANLSLQIGELDKALVMFTASVASAEPGSPELALAYCDRSFVLFQLKEYESCLRDISRARDMDSCPANMKKKVRDRQRQCLQLLQGRVTAEAENHSGWLVFCNFEPPNALLPNSSPKLKLECDEERGRYLIAIEDIEPGKFSSNFYK